MTTKLEAAARQALEALEEIHVGNMTPMAEENWNKAITALREALAEQADQEPVGGLWIDGIAMKPSEMEAIAKTWLVTQAEQESVAWVEVERGIPMRTKDLTDDEIARILVMDKVGFARAVIAADREKNK